MSKPRRGWVILTEDYLGRRPSQEGAVTLYRSQREAECELARWRMAFLEQVLAGTATMEEYDERYDIVELATWNGDTLRGVEEEWEWSPHAPA